MKKKSISIIIPLYNEEGNVKELHKKILQVCKKNNYKYEIIFVDDGSTDQTPEIIKQLKPATLIRFRKNFGQTAAIDAGIKHAKNDYLVTMDGDLQNDPSDIPLLLEHLEKNKLDVVSGWRKKRKDSLLKRFISRSANILRKMIINDGIHDSGCSLKVYKKECFEGVDLFGEMHRFIPAILIIQGFKVGELEVKHILRGSGKTKYNCSRTIKGFIDMLAVWFWKKYAIRPLHLLGGIGMLFIFLGIISGGITIYLFILGKSLSNTVFPLLTAFLFLIGLQCFIFGLIADMLSKSYFKKVRIDAYSIKNVTINEITKKSNKEKKR